MSSDENNKSETIIVDKTPVHPTPSQPRDHYFFLPTTAPPREWQFIGTTLMFNNYSMSKPHSPGTWNWLCTDILASANDCGHHNSVSTNSHGYLSSLVQIMACCLDGAKPLSEPMMANSHAITVSTEVSIAILRTFFNGYLCAILS